MSFEPTGLQPAEARVKRDNLALEVRRDFPMLAEGGLVYLDSAATSQKPRQVLRAMADHYERHCANVHRGLYRAAAEATAAYEEARTRVARFVGAHHRDGVVFTRNCTEAINLVALSWGRASLREDDEILTTVLEHHSNLVPWQQVARVTGARLRFLPADEGGRPDLGRLDELLGPRTRLVAVTGLSNVLGTTVALEPLVEAAHAAGALVLVDGAQLVMHRRVDLARLGADFFAFSGHKLLGPTGVGVLAARPELLERMEPLFTGGEMVLDVTLEDATWNDVPHRFEAGTPAIAEAIGLGAAVDYLERVGLERIARHDRRLAAHGLAALRQVEGLTLYSAPDVATFAFNLHDSRGLIHPHDVGTLLAQREIAVRAGHHCAKPLMRHLDVPACCRASAYLYNTTGELDTLAAALVEVREFFGR
jgi:cysteine desulfurase/selenocysteine lyase